MKSYNFSRRKTEKYHKKRVLSVQINIESVEIKTLFFVDGTLDSIIILRPSHQTLKRCPSGWGKGLSCGPSLRYFIKHICQNELDNERSFLAKHEAARPTKYLVWQRNGSKNGVRLFKTRC